MITWLICAVFSFVFALLFYDENKSSHEENSPFFLGFVFMLVFACSIGISIPLTAIAANNVEGPTKTEEINIVPFTDNVSNSKLNIYLFGGSLENKPCYYFYKKETDGSVILDSIYAKNTYIFEQDREDGVIKNLYTNKLPDRLWYTLFFATEGITWLDKHEVYIPNGTVKRVYNLDSN